MKKIMIFAITMLLCCVVLSGCNCSDKIGSGDINEQTHQQAVDSKKAESTAKEPQNDISTITLEEPLNDYVYYFHSYDQLIKALTSEISEEYLLLREEQEDCGKVYIDTLSNFSSGKLKVIVPQLNEVDIEIQPNQKYAQVDLDTSGLYNLPWFWYHCIVDNYDLDFRISYTHVLNSSELKLAQTYCDVLSIIWPDAPSPDNYQKFESYKNIYEKELMFKDGRTVTAMISELKDSSKIYVMFYLDESLFVLRAEAELFSDEFWNQFSLVQK